LVWIFFKVNWADEFFESGILANMLKQMHELSTEKANDVAQLVRRVRSGSNHLIIQQR